MASMRSLFLITTVLLLGACGSVSNQPDAENPPDADPCLTAACECTVATVDADCGPHTICETSSAGRFCECVPAYAEDGGGDCVFAGAPADPGFQDPTAWTTEAGTSVVPAGLGTGEIDATGVCNFAEIKQTFTMPPLDRAEPLRVSIKHRATGGPPFFLQVGVGGGWTEFPTSDTYTTDTFCLGPRAFGGPIEFTVGMMAPLSLCNGGTLSVDELRVEVADPGECPDPGNAVNGAFDSNGGWVFPTGPAVSGGFVPGVGDGGSRAGRVQYSTICGQGPLVGQLALPADVTNKAIELFWSAPAAAQVQLGLDGKMIGTVIGTGAAGRSHACLPAWAAGMAPRLEVMMLAASDGYSTCTAVTRDLIVDSIAIVDDVSCSNASDLPDPGFELLGLAGNPATGWGLAHGYVNGAITGGTDAINSLGLAHTGTGVLATKGGNGCQSTLTAGADATIIVPASGAGGGPAVKAFARASGANTNTESWMSLIRYAGNGQGDTPRQAFAMSPPVVVPETGAYVPTTLCLPSVMSGRPVTVRLTTGRVGGGGCGEVFNDLAYWDDVTVGTDPACPP